MTTLQKTLRYKYILQTYKISDQCLIESVKKVDLKHYYANANYLSIIIVVHSPKGMPINSRIQCASIESGM